MKVALIQTEIKDNDIDLNFQYVKLLLSKVDLDTDLVILPEMFLTGFVFDNSLAQVSGEKGLKLMRDFTLNTNIAIDGSLLVENEGKYYNRHYFITPKEEVFYNKVNLFSLSDEVKKLTAGNQKDVVIKYKDIKFKLLTCYDLRFPACSRNSFKEEEFLYDVLIYVASWPSDRREQWKKLLQARAIENQSYVIGVNRQGKDGKELLYSGDSCVIDSKGEFVAETKNWENIIHYYNIDKQSLDKSRKKFPSYLDWQEK